MAILIFSRVNLSKYCRKFAKQLKENVPLLIESLRISNEPNTKKEKEILLINCKM